MSLRTTLAIGLAVGLAAPGLAAAQPVPTTAQAIAADHRVGEYAIVNGLRVFYQVRGAGQPLVLIHGYPLNGRLFEHQLDYLSGLFQVITLDLPGFGKSGPVPTTETVPDYAGIVLGLMDQLHIQSAIVGGHSMGGQITLSLYDQAPSRVAGLILIDTNPAAPLAAEMAEFPGFGRQAQQDGVASIVPPIDAQMLTGRLRLSGAPAALTMIDILAEASLSGAIGGGHALATRPDFTALLPDIKVPTLVLEGFDDPVYGLAIAQMTAAAIPGSQLTLIPNSEHAAVYEQYPTADTAIALWWAKYGK